MHAAPSVSYPVGRSALAGLLHAGVFGLALAVVGAWSLQADALAWRHAFAFAVLAACGLFAGLAWVRSPTGILHWDGDAWQWQGGAQSIAGTVLPTLDLQSHLLLRWRADAGGTRWLWAQQESDSAHWEALRRAVYSRASAPIPTFPRRGKESLPDGKPPAAEQ